MKTTYRPFARKYRQFNNQAKQIKRLHNEGKFNTLSESRRQEMLDRLKRMYLELRGKLQHWRLKKTLVGLSFLLLGAGTAPQANAQTFGSPQLNPLGLSAIPDGYNFIALADLDNDGDLDLFESIVEDSGTGFYFSNNNGTSDSPNFEAPVSAPFGLQTNNFAVNPVFTDIDNDGDLDLFFGGNDGAYGGEMTFYENIGTATTPNFGPVQVNPFGITNTDYFSIPAFADLDGDGDQDLVVTEIYSALSYFENTGTPEAPAFSLSPNVPFNLAGVSGPLTFMDFADLDNDGDLDLMAGGFYDEYSYLSSFFYAENTGTSTDASFENYVENPFDIVSIEAYLSQPVFADIDSDGDLDLFSSAAYYGVVLFENLGTAPTSDDAMVETFISTPYNFAASDFSFFDADGDDFKLLKITGLTSVGTLQLDGVDVIIDQVIDVSNLPMLAFTPIDNEEGDPYDTFTFQVGDESEVFSNDHTMTISVGGVSTKDNLLNASLTVFPNPTTDLIQLDLKSVTTLTNVQIILFDKGGRALAKQSATIAGNVWQQQFDVSEFAAGAYFIQIEADGKTVSTQFVKK